jgi:choline dehydrogenase
MGSPDEESSVVDPACRVIGLEGLRVVDASIMPEIVNSNTHATVVMLAEKAADMIIQGEQLKTVEREGQACPSQ